ncbi:MAG TPA: family 43 glycosylhydrolase, partial [Verrucomicrobiota bacterium]|nr:family 43 glycosylhydrolase [Verrucomicrobiota bacterium]
MKFQNRLLTLFVAVATSLTSLADYPVVSHRYAADPTALEYNGRLYLYCSNDDENGTNSYVMSSITCFSTDDLKNWTDHGEVFRANTTSWASLTWAPSAVSNSSRVYLYFANGAGNIGVATSSVPTGPFTDARGSALITGSTPGASTSTQWLFDPGVFIDDNGQAYLYFGGQYPTNSRVI